MRTISMDTFKAGLDRYMVNAATGNEAIAVDIGLHRAVIIDESEWDILRGAFAMLTDRERDDG